MIIIVVAVNIKFMFGQLEFICTYVIFFVDVTLVFVVVVVVNAVLGFLFLFLITLYLVVVGRKRPSEAPGGCHLVCVVGWDGWVGLYGWVG